MKKIIVVIFAMLCLCSPTAPKQNTDCAGNWIYVGDDRILYLTVTPQDSLFCRFYLPGDTLPVLWSRGTLDCYSTYRDSACTLLTDSCAVLAMYRSGAQLVVSQGKNSFTFTRE